MPKLKLRDVEDFVDIGSRLPELPWQKRERLRLLGIASDAIEMFVENAELCAFFETAIAENISTARLASNYLVTDVIGLGGVGSMKPNAFAELIAMVGAGDLSSRGAKDVLALLVAQGGSARELAEARGLLQVHDASALKTIVERIISANDSAVRQYRGGKETALQFLVGACMKESRGSGNPQAFRTLLVEILK